MSLPSPIFRAMPSRTAHESTELEVASSPGQAPDFRHVRTWIFDLDHTLYRMNPVTMREVEERIRRFVQRHLGLPRDEAFAIQKKYMREYGITLAGMMKHHGVDPDAYHAEINDIEALDLSPNVPLRCALARLPGECFVFTNNCGTFAREVLARLDVGDLFADVLDIRALGYVPKPGAGAYQALVRRTGCDPKQTALFDDRACNLPPARALGMTTVWLNQGSATAEERASIDHETDDLARFLQSIRIQ
jgi:putative hydrolase of the HAD superfamily